jgi:hypothetical protein
VESILPAVTQPPHVDTAPWEKVQEWTDTAFSSPIVTVEAVNAVYEDPDFLDQFRPLFADGIEQTPRAVFTTGLSFSRDLPGEETPKKVLGIAAKYASREFKKSLAEDGLVNVRQTGSQDLRLRGRRTAKAFQYDANYPISGAAVGVPDANPELKIRVWAALWPTRTSFEMAGGIYPLEDLAEAVARAGGETDVTVEAQPGGDRRLVLDRIREAAE